MSNPLGEPAWADPFTSVGFVYVAEAVEIGGVIFDMGDRTEFIVNGDGCMFTISDSKIDMEFPQVVISEGWQPRVIEFVRAYCALYDYSPPIPLEPA